jgi:glutathione peroxidase
VSLYDIPLRTLTGEPASLADYRDSALLIVNVASKCGLTPQYEALQALLEKYSGQGFSVIGVPCNQFMGQEPGTEAEIKDFCETRFNIDFPLTSKVDVKGDDAHPFYKWARDVLGEPAEPVWNFHKILIGKDGQAIRAFGPRTEPQDADMTAEIEKAL